MVSTIIECKFNPERFYDILKVTYYRISTIKMLAFQCAREHMKLQQI